jgi:GNAT superfamily N-acetyltransferase
MVTIRLARLKEIPAIIALRRAAAEDLTRRVGVTGDWSRVYVLPVIRRAVLGGPLCVIEDAGEMVGTFTLDQRAKGYYRPEWFANPADPAFYLRSLSIRVDKQRQGIGRKALAAVEDMARHGGVKAIRCDTYAGEAGADGFYAKCGFTALRGIDDGGTRLVIYEKLVG